MVDFGKQQYPAQQQFPNPGYGSAPGSTVGQAGGYAGMAQVRPRFGDINPNWGWVVVSIVFFWPIGIAAANAAGRVLPAMLDGDYGRAHNESRRARKLSIIALCITIGLAILYIVGAIVLLNVAANDCVGADC